METMAKVVEEIAWKEASPIPRTLNEPAASLSPSLDCRSQDAPLGWQPQKEVPLSRKPGHGGGSERADSKRVHDRWVLN